MFHSLVKLAAKIPLLKKLQTVQIAAGVLSHELKPEPLAKPDPLELTPLAVNFLDVCFSEDFYNLQTRLPAMIAAYGAGWHDARDTQTRVSELLNGQHVGWSDVGTISNRDGKKRHLNLVRSVSVSLHKITPSIAVVSYEVRPAAEYVARFEAILKAPGKPRVTLEALRQPRVRYSNPIEDRQREIELLLLDLNACVVRLVRSCAAGYWSAAGPLPSVVVYGLRGDLASAPNGFLHSMGLLGLLHYSGEGGLQLLCDDPIRRPRLSPNWRLVVDLDKYVTSDDLKNYGVSGKPDEAALVKLGISEELPDIRVAYAIRELVERQREEISTLRLKITPALALTRAVLSRLFYRPSFKHARSLGWSAFHQNRLEAELSQRTIDRLKSQFQIPLKRKSPVDQEERVFSDDWSSTVPQLIEHCNSQLSVLREAHRETLDLGLQSATLRLTWVGIALTVVGIVLALPENLRKKLLDFILSPFGLSGG